MYSKVELSVAYIELFKNTCEQRRTVANTAQKHERFYFLLFFFASVVFIFLFSLLARPGPGGGVVCIANFESAGQARSLVPFG